jgi:PLP dependent protein
LPVNKQAYQHIINELRPNNVTLVAVSKTKPIEDIKELYNLGHRDFAENYVQELEEKHKQLPTDIRWHFIGHLQTNKVKQIATFVRLIHSVDSLKLLKEINKQAEKNNRVVDCLLQVHIAQEETKFGLDEEELNEILNTNSSKPALPAGRLHALKNVRVVGLMGMASFTNDMMKVRNEFKYLKSIFDKLVTRNSQLVTLSMGMSSDYKIAIEEGSNMIRVGSLLFGERK